MPSKYFGTTGTGPVPVSPTGYGLPDWEEGAYSTRRPWDQVVWCEAAGCPKDKCVACKEAAAR